MNEATCSYCGHAAHLPSNWNPNSIRLDADTCQWGLGMAMMQTCNCPHQIIKTGPIERGPHPQGKAQEEK